MADSDTTRWVTFDVYSALFDFRVTLVPRLAAACPQLGQVRTAALLDLWRSRQLAAAMQHALLQRGHMPFRQATRLALDYALPAFDMVLPETTCAGLVAAWDELDPWPEAAGVLAELRQRGYRLALLSNGDQDMLEALAARLPGGVDAVLSAERASAYKPQPEVYRLALETLDVPTRALLHVAGSSTDVMGAKAAGLRCAWSNRFHDRMLDPRFVPDYMFEDLSGLATVLGPEAPQ